ncbi:hypothetical protein Tco_1556576 [Tanacetum coccineum]
MQLQMIRSKIDALRVSHPNQHTPIRPPTLLVRSPVLPPPLPVRPPVLPTRDAAVCRPALCVVILGCIVYAREDIEVKRFHGVGWAHGSHFFHLDHSGSIFRMFVLEVKIDLEIGSKVVQSFALRIYAKSMFVAIETRFRGNAATKKTQKTLLKQQYENFSATKDLNLKFLSSLPPEWNTHVVVWMNKPEIETMSIDDLYNNFKIVEQKIKKIVGTSSGGQNLAFLIAPSSNSINNANTAYSQVSAASPSVNIVSLRANHDDDLESTGSEVATLFAKWSVTTVISWDTLPGGAEHQEARKIKGTSSVKHDLNGISSQTVYTDKTCSKTCLNNYETLKKKYDDLLAKQLQTKFELATYKRGLDTVEAQLVTYRKNEVLFSEEVVVLKREVGIKQYEINTLKAEPNKLDLSYSGLDEFKEPEFKGYGLENNKKESNVVKESDNSKENSDKSLVKEQESQVKSSFVEGCGSNTSKRVSEVEPKKVRENNDAPIIEDLVSDDEEQDESMTKPVKKTIIHTAAKIEKPFRKSVRYAEMYRSQRTRGNQRNWNGQKSNQLVVSGNNYNRVNNYYYAKTSHHRTHKNVTPRAVLLRTGLKPLSTTKLVYTAHPKPIVHYDRPKTHFYKSAQSTVQRPFYKKPALTNRHFNHKVNTVRPRIINTARSYRTPVNTVRPRIVNTVRSYRTPVNTVRPRVVNTARSNRTSVNAARENGFNAVKPSACWVWRPIKPNSVSITLNRYNYIDARGISKSVMAWFDGGYVAFGGGAYGGKISGKENYYCQANVNAVQRSWAPKLQLFSNSYQLRHCLRGGISQEVGTPRYLSLVVPLTKVGDEVVHKELGDRMERATTTASSLEAEQDSGSGPRCQDTILGDVNAQTRFEITSIQSIDPPLSRGYTLGSGEDSMKLIGIDEIFPKFAETHNVVAFLKKPEESDRFAEIIDFLDVDVSLVDETQERQDDLIFDSEVLEVDVMHVEAKVDGKDEQSTKTDDSTAGEAATTTGDDSVVPTTNEEITLAQTLIQIKAAKPKVVTTAATTATTTRPKDKRVVVQEPSEFRFPIEIKLSSSKDKGKGIMIEPEVPLKRKDQIALDEQIARDIQAKLDAELLEEQKLARKQEEEANRALIESWENTQAMMEANRLLAERL